MHRNYYLFKRQVDFLNQKLNKAIITNCLTHRKDELVLEISATDSYFLRIGVQIYLPYLVLYKSQNIKDPCVNFFPEIFGHEINKFHIEPYDKIVYLQLDNFSLQMIFFGKNPNVFLLDGTNNILSSFKTSTPSKELRKHDIIFNPHNAQLSELHKLIHSGREWPCDNFLSHHFGGFNQIISREVCYRCHIDPLVKINTLSQQALTNLHKTIRIIAQELNTNKAHLYFVDNQICYISLIKLTHISRELTYRLYNDVNEAWKNYLNYHQKKKRFDELMQVVQNGLKKRINSLKNGLKNIIAAEKIEAKKREAELKGNLLLTYISELHKGMKEVQLKNIFSEQQELVTIKLNPAKSIQENAQKYFSKYKDITDQKLLITVRKNSYQSELEYWQDLYQKSECIANVKQVEKLYDLLVDKKVLQTPDAASSRQDSLQGSFYRLLLGKKWEVYIGKNAHNNDLLTFRFAHKFDLWFHAQGVTGSHVIIRLPSKDHLPAQEIIEQAASVAAYFSSARHSSTVPVNFTRVRYVRKPRKAAPGTVIITNEKTLFVSPKKFI